MNADLPAASTEPTAPIMDEGQGTERDSGNQASAAGPMASFWAKKTAASSASPKDTRLNRHIAVFGASGTENPWGDPSGAVHHTQARRESAVITDPKAELYNDTAELFRKNGYEVKVFNLVDPRHGDSWNCMSDLNGDTLLAQVLTNVIISNTSEGKGDHFWDNGEANLLKALVLYIDLDRSRGRDESLAAAYQLLTQNSERQLTALLKKLPLDHPARAPFNLSRRPATRCVPASSLDGHPVTGLTERGCAGTSSAAAISISGARQAPYATSSYSAIGTQPMAFLSSLFFSFLFIKLVRYADSTPELRCKVPSTSSSMSSTIMGKLGGAADGSDFARTLSVIRSRAIYVMLAAEPRSAPELVSQQSLGEIVGNLDGSLCWAVPMRSAPNTSLPRGAVYVGGDQPTMTVRKTIAVAQVVPQYRQTEGQGRRRLLTPDEVLRIPNEELLVVIRGHNVLKLKKFDYADHPLAKELTPVSILDYYPRTRQRLFSRPRRLCHAQRLRSGLTHRPYPQNAELCTAPQNRRASFELNDLTKRVDI